MIRLEKLQKEGYIKLKKVIPKNLIKNFHNEVSSIEKQFRIESNEHNKNFSNFFSKKSSRSRIYSLMQNLNSVRKISNYLDLYLEKNNVFKKLKFVNRSINNGLIISLQGDNKNLSPPHQDIYSFKSSFFLKAWIPLTTVDKTYGSMKVYKSSHLNGFVKPTFKNSKSTYPSFSKKYLSEFECETFKLMPSDIVIFNPFVIHQSISNKSSVTRFTIGVEFHGVTLNEDENFIKKINFFIEERKKRRQINLLKKN